MSSGLLIMPGFLPPIYDVARGSADCGIRVCGRTDLPGLAVVDRAVVVVAGTGAGTVAAGIAAAVVPGVLRHIASCHTGPRKAVAGCSLDAAAAAAAEVVQVEAQTVAAQADPAGSSKCSGVVGPWCQRKSRHCIAGQAA